MGNRAATANAMVSKVAECLCNVGRNQVNIVSMLLELAGNKDAHDEHFGDCLKFPASPIPWLVVFVAPAMLSSGFSVVFPTVAGMEAANDQGTKQCALSRALGAMYKHDNELDVEDVQTFFLPNVVLQPITPEDRTRQCVSCLCRSASRFLSIYENYVNAGGSTQISFVSKALSTDSLAKIFLRKSRSSLAQLSERNKMSKSTKQALEDSVSIAKRLKKVATTAVEMSTDPTKIYVSAPMVEKVLEVKVRQVCSCLTAPIFV